MEKLESIIEITYQEYDQDWTGYILSKSVLIDGEDATDDNWELLPEYEDCVWVSDVDGQRTYTPTLVREADILHQCVECDALYSGWGYVEPASGSGLTDLGGEPSYYIEGFTDPDDGGFELYAPEVHPKYGTPWVEFTMYLD
jgi:hypothetical protein